MAERHTQIRISQIKNIISDKIESNVMLNAFRIAINGALTQYGMIDGIIDEFEDETGVDTGASTNEDYDSSNDLYKPTVVADLELDYMEYASDGAAQAAYVSSDGEAGIDSDTKLMLHCNGSDESTTFTDDSTSSHTVTANGNAQLDTAQKKFGTASGLFDGDGDYLSIPDSDDFNFGSGDFVIDCQVRFNTQPGLNEHYVIYEQYIDVSNFLIWEWRDSGGTKRLRLHIGDGSVTELWFNWSPSINTWYHLAVVRDGNNVRAFVDGTQVGSTGSYSGTIPNFAASVYIGRYEWSASFQYFDGWIDELRISKGTNRGWTSNFTAPSAEYTSTANLQCYSEASIKNQGSYSLKAIAQATDSLNDTLTKSSLSIDLTNKNTLKFWAYASRTGTNLQLQIHDSGGTTSTKDIIISSANTWTEITWDISGISNANKDDIDQIIIKVTNADSINTFYIDNFYAPGLTNNMTLIANTTVAEATPDTARIVLFEEDVDSITENTDIKAYVSRDGGSTFAQVTLTDEGDYQSGRRVLTGTVDLTQSGIGSGTNMEWKVETLNNKSLKLHGVGALWS